MANFSIDVPQIISTLTAQLNFKTQFSAFTTNAERVQLCQAQKEVQLWADLFVSKFVSNRSALKCQNTAAEYREKGNDHFRGGNFQSAIQRYSMAICLAPQSVDDTASGLGSELALAYGNRSAAYFRLGQHDINDALAHGYAQFKSVTKLHLRKCDCLIQLGRVSEAQKFLYFMQKPTGNENDTKCWIELFARIKLARINLDVDNKDESTRICEVSLIEKLTNKGLFKSNEKISSFSTKVAVHYDSEKGRHLVAQEDIKFGDILAVSKPYATLLGWKDDTKDYSLKRCHHCYRDIFQEDLVSIRPHPCPRCSSVVYCSEECRTESENSYHQFECAQHDMLVQVPRFSRMSLRMLYRAGIDQIRSAVSATENPSHFSEQPDGHYSHVYQLVHHSDRPLESLDIFYGEMLECSLFACLLLQLAKNAHFPINSEGEGEKLIGGILLRHILQARFNVFHYSPFDKKVSSFPVQLDLYPMYASTLNHSCMANARLESPKDQYVCLPQAARPISAGTEITIIER